MTATPLTAAEIAELQRDYALSDQGRWFSQFVRPPHGPEQFVVKVSDGKTHYSIAEVRSFDRREENARIIAALHREWPRIALALAERDQRIAELEHLRAAERPVAARAVGLQVECDELRALVREAQHMSWDSDTLIGPDWDERATKALGDEEPQ